MNIQDGMIQGRQALNLLAILLITGCASTAAPEKMTHPDFSGNTLTAERKLAIDRCTRENTSTEFVDYRNEVSMDTNSGIAQQSQRISEMAAMNEAIVACMRRKGWRF